VVRWSPSWDGTGGRGGACWGVALVPVGHRTCAEVGIGRRWDGKGVQSLSERRKHGVGGWARRPLERHPREMGQGRHGGH
jgi:hypothetical protein